jgi:hypothetical protein
MMVVEIGWTCLPCPDGIIEVVHGFFMIDNRYCVHASKCFRFENYGLI